MPTSSLGSASDRLGGLRVMWKQHCRSPRHSLLLPLLIGGVHLLSSHRPLSSRSGICTWVTFGHKNQKGWEVMSYFSPEIWAQS